MTAHEGESYLRRGRGWRVGGYVIRRLVQLRPLYACALNGLLTKVRDFWGNLLRAKQPSHHDTDPEITSVYSYIRFLYHRILYETKFLSPNLSLRRMRLVCLPIPVVAVIYSLWICCSSCFPCVWSLHKQILQENSNLNWKTSYTYTTHCTSKYKTS
jgi:hypothetical protein